MERGNLSYKVQQLINQVLSTVMRDTLSPGKSEKMSETCSGFICKCFKVCSVTLKCQYAHVWKILNCLQQIYQLYGHNIKGICFSLVVTVDYPLSSFVA